MKRWTTFVLVMVVLLGGATNAAADVWANGVKLNSSGVKGVASDFNVLQRHPYEHENYVDVIEGKGGVGGTYTGFGWQITDFVRYPQNRFDLNLHVKWPNGTESYYDYLQDMSQDAWHRIKVDYQNNGYWDLYLDSNKITTANWPYYTASDTSEKTQIEVGDYAEPVYFYAGHAYNVWLKRADNTWVQQGSSWSYTPFADDTLVYDNPFATLIINASWNWEAKK